MACEANEATDEAMVEKGMGAKASSREPVTTPPSARRGTRRALGERCMLKVGVKRLREEKQDVR